MITEVDGPPVAYFEVSDGVNLVRRVYRTLRAPSDEVLADNIDRLKAAMPEGSILFWRRRPVSGDPYCRLITSEPLSDELWKECGWDQTGTGYSPP